MNETGGYYNIGGRRIVTLEVMRKTYNRRYPDTVPPLTPDKPSVGVANLVALTIVVIAVNVLSGAHTIPMIQEFYDLPGPLLTFIGVSGFLAIEGAMVLLMSQKQRSRLAWLVIGLAFAAALSANTYKTFEVFASSDTNPFVTAIALLFGIFAPSTNLVAGEVLHNMQIQYQRSKVENQEQYHLKVREYMKGLYAYYRGYLTRMKLKPEVIELIITGNLEALNEEDEVIDVTREDEDVKPKGKDKPLTPAVINLIEQWEDDGVDPEHESVDDLRKRYEVSRTTVYEARKAWKDR